jgi:hypothetical protein
MDTPTLIGTGFFITAGVVWVLCAYLCYQTAPKRGRRALTWGILGIFTGPFALFALYLLPRGHVESHGHAAQKQDPRASLYEVPKKKKR